MNKLLSLAFALAGATACAQTNLRGTITNTEGQPLFGVAVVVGDQAFGTTTDAQGAYRLSGLRFGSNPLRECVPPLCFPVACPARHSLAMGQASMDLRGLWASVEGPLTRIIHEPD